MRADAPACPPNARQSSTMTESPSERRIHGRRQPRGTRADDGDVMTTPGSIDVADQADAARQLVLARVAQHVAIRTQHERQFARTDLETLDEGEGATVAIGIEALVRMAITREEVLQPQHVAIAGDAHDDRAADVAFQQADAAQDERAHHPSRRSPPRRRSVRASAGAIPRSPRRSDSATASTSAGRPDSCASSPRKPPAQR